ncbi:MAG TPA: Mov34/MPN/PAD-1 family protein [Nitrospirota bacterium]|nr:Mov34/MPN/PAD-1 family protein [Nitrospirota bacterium]
MRFFPQSVAAIYKQALDEYPSECCGIVTGRADVQNVHPLVNIQERLHADDPETHPRDSRSAYAVDRNEVEQILHEAVRANETILAFYHSHIDCDAYFSQMDKEAQTVFGEPEFPDAVHVVVALREGKIGEMKGYLWDSTKQDFISVEVL